MKRTLTGTVVNNRWWSALKRAIPFESIRFSLYNARTEERLVKCLDEALRLGSASQIFVALDHHLEVKPRRCRVGTKIRAMGREGSNVAGWVCTVETQRGNVRSLTDEHERLVK